MVAVDFEMSLKNTSNISHFGIFLRVQSSIKLKLWG